MRAMRAASSNPKPRSPPCSPARWPAASGICEQISRGGRGGTEVTETSATSATPRANSNVAPGKMLEVFHEIQFPTAIAFHSSGGPERKTEIVTLGSGFEERNAVWANSRRRYDVGYGV